MTKEQTPQDANEATIGAVASTAMLCGCGRPVRYMTQTGDACNKYMRCLTYEELKLALAKANILLLAYRNKRAVDGLNGRTWDACKHFEAEADIEALEQTHNEELRGGPLADRPA